MTRPWRCVLALGLLVSACTDRGVDGPWDRDFNLGERGAYISEVDCDPMPPLELVVGNDLDSFAPFDEGDLGDVVDGTVELGVLVGPVDPDHAGFELIVQTQMDTEVGCDDECEMAGLVERTTRGQRRVYVETPELLENGDEVTARQTDIIVESGRFSTLAAVARDACGRVAFARY